MAPLCSHSEVVLGSVETTWASVPRSRCSENVILFYLQQTSRPVFAPRRAAFGESRTDGGGKWLIRSASC